MGKYKKLFLYMMVGCLIPSCLFGCSPAKNDPSGAQDYGQYEDIASAPADAEFRFQTGLPEAQPLYPESRGTTYYVSVSGSTDNDGKSEDAPLAGVSAVNRLDLQPGDVVLFKAGDVFEGTTLRVLKSGADDNPIRYGSYGEGRATIRTRSVAAVYFQDVSNIVVENLELIIEAPDRTSDGGSAPGALQGEYTYEGVNSKNIYLLGNKISGSGFRSLANGIVINSKFNYGSDGSAVPHDLLSNVYIKNNEVSNIGVTGISITSWFLDLNLTATDVEIYRNIFMDENIVYDIGQIGMYICCCSDSTMNRNLVYRCGMNDDGWVSVGDCGMMTLSCDNCQMNNNVIYDCRTAGMTFDGMGIDIDWNCNEIEVRYNHCYNNQGSGIATMANVNCVIADNRIENNECFGNQKGQLQITDFTAVYQSLDPEMFATKNLLVENNLIVNDRESAYPFYVYHLDGGLPNWENNRFLGNHVVNDFKAEMPRYVFVSGDTPWYQFENNRYYNNELSAFSCVDMTDGFLINMEATALPSGYCNEFAVWQKRDLNSTLEPLSTAAPSKPEGLTATYQDGSLLLSWQPSQGDIWRYEVFMVEEGEGLSHLDLLTTDTKTGYQFEPETAGTFCFVVRPESSRGVYGKAAKIKVTLEP